MLTPSFPPFSRFQFLEQFHKITVFVSGFGRVGEFGVNFGQNFEETLEDGKEMTGGATNDTKLFVYPPVFNVHATPAELHYSGVEDGDKENSKPHVSKVINLQEKEEF